MTNGASFIYREANSRYIGVQFSVEGRDLASAVDDAIKQVQARRSHCPRAIAPTGAANTANTPPPASSCAHPAADLVADLPAAVRALQQFQIPLHHRGGRAAVGAGRRDRWRCCSPARPSRSRPASGFLALFGVSVLTAVVYISYVNELRRDGMPIAEAVREGADPAAAAHHDDGAGGGVGTVAGGARHRRRHRLAEARSRW